jgi:4-hydroxy-3-polyprenylbenzoate decarboxylase
MSVSIHRMRVLDDRRMTIWMLPGRDLERLYLAAIERGSPLPLSINIGVPPIVYFTSSLSTPFIDPGAGELEVAGAAQGSPIEIARCATNAAFCLAQSEIVIEGELLPELAAEHSDPVNRLGMPEFLGYMGKAQPALPTISISAVFHRRNALYQTFLGPGKEQSELLALPTEAGMTALLAQEFADDFELLDAHYLAAGGGQLVLVLKIQKHRDEPGVMVRLRDAVTSRHRLTKAIWVVDEDVDIHSPEDLLWASTTRFQPQRDLYLQSGQPGFPLDPSQAPGYLDAEVAITDRYLMDFTAPVALRARFARA